MRAREDQRQSREEIARVLDTVREVVVAMARLEKRPAEAETPAETSEPLHVPPPPRPPPPPQFPPILTPTPAVSGHEVPPSSMPVMVPAPRQESSGQADAARPRQFIAGESSGSQRPQQVEQWDVNHFRKNHGELFYGSDDLEESLVLLDTAR